MKFYKNVIILGIIVVLLSAAYFITERKNAQSAIETSTANKIKILNLKLDDISKIEINNKREKLLFEKKQGKWVLVEPADIKYDQAVANGLPLSIFYITANKLIAEKSTDFTQYGLDNPAIISISTPGGKNSTLEIGNLTSSKDSYYAKLNESSSIYTIDKNKVESILLTQNAVKDKNVLSLSRELRPRMLAEDITRVTLKKIVH
ncbi:DUF4340 domain-containing protein [Clostridium sp. BJN0013]|uniref:DUF4340 domain-containing protein n=1 Tax=Clostridium sp. BJN0013 TaxID=3236840 RepID=UPI0034C5BD24